MLSSRGTVNVVSYSMACGKSLWPMWTRLETTQSDSALSLRAGSLPDFSPGVSQNAIWIVVFSSAPWTWRRNSLLDDLSPAPSSREPASVGL